MNQKRLLLAVLPLALLACSTVEDTSMSFFITSAGNGDGANLGGLEGADLHCQALADAAGSERTWHAYLSTTGPEGVNARDRIGTGPWYNAMGVKIADDLAQLHGDSNNLTKATQLTEQADSVNGRGDSPNMHDIMTGSNLDGTAVAGEEDTTCSNWASNGEGSTMVGHHDRDGGGANPTSWNSAHGSRGCSLENLQGSGGNGFFYCFAIG